MATNHTGWKLLTDADLAGNDILDTVGGGLVDGVDISTFATGGSLDHTKLINIGTLTHATIDSYLNQPVQTTSSPTFANITVSGLTITRVPYTSTGGLLIDNAAFTFTTATGLLTATAFTATGIGTFDHIVETGVSSYLKLDASNSPLTGNAEISKADPELRLTDTGNSNYLRLTKSDTTNYAYQYNKTLSVGALGKAINFDGTNDYVDCGNGASLKLQEFTWEFWAKSNADGSQGVMGGLGTYNLQGFGLFHSGVGNNYNFWSGNGTKAETVANIFDITTDQFNHYVVTRTGNTLKAYKNGVLTKTDTTTLKNPTSFGTTPFLIGQTINITYNFNGSIDEVRIYNRALEQAEITYNYNAGAGIYTPQSTSGLVGWWHMDEGAGTTTADSSGNGNTGTLTNGPTWVDGKVYLDGTTVEPTIWSSRDGLLIGEYAINTYGDTNSRGVFEGKTLRFNIGGAEKAQLDASGNFGLGTTTPLRRLDINEASGNCLRLIYNDSDGSAAYYADFLVNSAGKNTQNAVGGFGWQFNGTEQIALLDGILQPTTTNDIDLGDSTHLLKDVWQLGKHYFRDSAIYINSNDDGHLDLTADVSIDLNAPARTAGRIKTVSTKTTTYTITSTDEVIVCNSTTAFTVTLPAATGSGATFTIANISSRLITLDGNSSDTINGELVQYIPESNTLTVTDYAANKWIVI